MTIPPTFVPKETQPAPRGALFESEPRRVEDGQGSGLMTWKRGAGFVTSPRNDGLILLRPSIRGAVIATSPGSRSWLARRLDILFVVVEERLYSSEHRPTLRRLFVCA